MTASDYDTRFGGIQRLYGRQAAARIQALRVCVIGMGGVGSWAVEALARSGVADLTLIDYDEICLTNVNRQVHALDGSVGQKKIAAMAQRVQQIMQIEYFYPINHQWRVLHSQDFTNDISLEYGDEPLSPVPLGA